MEIDDQAPEWKVHYDNLEKRMNNMERAFFGFLDPETNEFRSGLLQNVADATKAIIQTASEVGEVKKWLKWGAIAFVLLLVAVAFPKLWQLITEIAKVAS